MKSNSITIIIPCYNEEDVILHFFNEICKIIENTYGYYFRLLFIDDGSRDNTLNIIKEISYSNKFVEYISFSKNFGKEAAIYAGLSNATGDIIAIMDADLQDPPYLLPQMIYWIEKGYDSVATRRISRTGEPVIRSCFARLFYKIINKISNIEIVDGARDYRVMTKKVAKSVISLAEYHRFSKGIFSWIGFKTKWLEYENIERVDGSTKWSFWKLFKYAVEGIVAFTTIPIRLASFFGIIISFIAFLYALFIIARTFIFGVDVPGYASILAAILGIGGIQLLSIGIIGEYLARTYLETKHRPLYVIGETNILDKMSSEQYEYF